MRRSLMLLASLLLVTSMLSGCVVLPVWPGGYYGGYYGGYHHGGHHHGGW